MEKFWTRASDMAAPTVNGGVGFLLLSRSRSVVVAPGARADARHVGAVDVDRDRGGVGRVVDPMDVAGGREAGHVADVVVAAADRVEIGVEQLLVLDPLDDAEDAPGHVVVDALELTGPPHQSDD